MIAGRLSCSFIDFPGHLAAVLFTQGCNLRCRYCHNPALCPMPRACGGVDDGTLRFLASRRGLLSGVVVTGGEPTLHAALPSLLGAVRSQGFRVKLDTNGTRPAIVERLLAGGLVDFVAVDVKLAPGVPSHWLCGRFGQPETALETLDVVRAAGIPAEARTTVVRGMHDGPGLARIAELLAKAGVGAWRLQPVRNARVLDRTVALLPPEPHVLSQALAAAASMGLDAAVRGV